MNQCIFSGWDQLILPLFVPLNIEERIEPSINHDPVFDPAVQQYQWSQEAIEKLHLALLDEALETLSDNRLSFKRADEIFLWVDSPTVPQAQIYKQPFSFQFCCQLAGYDHEELAEGLHQSFTSLRCLNNKTDVNIRLSSGDTK